MIRISETAINPEAEVAAFRMSFASDGGAPGAIASFIGIVRNDGRTDGETTTALILSHYPEFTEKQIEAFVTQANSRWALQGSLILHRVGKMSVGEPIVVVAVASAHRRDAFEACDYLMDRLKCDAPFWKQETTGGETRWIEPRAQDVSDLGRWSS